MERISLSLSLSLYRAHLLSPHSRAKLAGWLARWLAGSLASFLTVFCEKELVKVACLVCRNDVAYAINDRNWKIFEASAASVM